MTIDCNSAKTMQIYSKLEYGESQLNILNSSLDPIGSISKFVGRSLMWASAKLTTIDVVLTITYEKMRCNELWLLAWEQ